MIPVTFKHANDECTNDGDLKNVSMLPLPCHVGYESDMQSIVTCWQLSKEDLEEVAKTGVVWLVIRGNQQPICRIQTEYPFID